MVKEVLGCESQDRDRLTVLWDNPVDLCGRCLDRCDFWVSSDAENMDRITITQLFSGGGGSIWTQHILNGMHNRVSSSSKKVKVQPCG